MAPGGVWRVASTAGHVLLLLSVCVHGFQWTSDIQNGGKLQRCVGDNVTFPWSYVTKSEEDVIVQFWFSNKSGSFASYFAGNFMTSWYRVTQAGPAEVTLSNVSTADDDTYGVSVLLYDRQEPLTQHVTLTVAEPPKTTDGQLHVTEHIKNSTSGTRNTSHPHMRLHCGEFLSLGFPPVSVLWTDPSGHRLPSTTFSDGYFHFDLDPHARGGNYTCSVQREAEASHCLASDSPLLMAAGWELASMETMVLDQGAELRQLRRTLEVLSQQVSLSHVTHTNTSGALWNSVTALEQWQTNRTEVLEGQVAELRQASAEQKKAISILVNRVSELHDTNTALRQASADQNNTISSLHSHVADLQEKNANQNTQISGFHKQVSDQNTHISSLQSQVAGQNTQIAGLQKQNTSLNTQISSLETENAYLNTQISDLKKDNADQNTQMSGLQKQNAFLNTQISDLKKENADQKTQIFSLQSDLQTVHTNLENVDDLGQNLTFVTSQLMTKTDRLQVSQESLSSDMRAQTQQVTSLQTNVSSLQGDVNRRGTTLTTLETEFERINTLTAPLHNKAGFYVYLDAPTVIANRPVVFKLGSHVGGGYNANSGVYTAPYSGWYTLQAQLFPHQDSDKDLWFDIVHNSVNTARAVCHQKPLGTFTCITSISMYVAMGDRLWVQPQFGGRYWISPHDNFFSGVLVTPD